MPDREQRGRKLRKNAGPGANIICNLARAHYLGRAIVACDGTPAARQPFHFTLLCSAGPRPRIPFSVKEPALPIGTAALLDNTETV
jgi:hypothetical protein